VVEYVYFTVMKSQRPTLSVYPWSNGRKWKFEPLSSHDMLQAVCI